MTCDEHGPAKVTSKSSFYDKDIERRISKDYCRGIGPRARDPCRYWAGGPI